MQSMEQSRWQILQGPFQSINDCVLTTKHGHSKVLMELSVISMKNNNFFWWVLLLLAACAFDNFQNHNISIVGVSFDSEKDLKSFKEKYALNFDLLSDTDRLMANAYDVNKWYFFPSRKTFLIDERGILIHIFDDVNLNSHPDDILKFFEHK